MPPRSSSAMLIERVSNLSVDLEVDVQVPASQVPQLILDQSVPNPWVQTMPLLLPDPHLVAKGHCTLVDPLILVMSEILLD